MSNPADLCAQPGCGHRYPLHQTFDGGCSENCICIAFVARSAPTAPPDPDVEHAVSFDCDFRGPHPASLCTAAGGGVYAVFGGSPAETPAAPLLLTCPFCGESDVALHPNDIAKHGAEMGIPGHLAFFAHCDGCGVNGPVGESEPESVELWNRRSAALPSSEPAPESSEYTMDCGYTLTFDPTDGQFRIYNTRGGAYAYRIYIDAGARAWLAAKLSGRSPVRETLGEQEVATVTRESGSPSAFDIEAALHELDDWRRYHGRAYDADAEADRVWKSIVANFTRLRTLEAAAQQVCTECEGDTSPSNGSIDRLRAALHRDPQPVSGSQETDDRGSGSV